MVEVQEEFKGWRFTVISGEKMFADFPDEEEFRVGKQWCEIILPAMRKLMDYKNVQVQQRNIQKIDWEEYLK